MKHIPCSIYCPSYLLVHLVSHVCAPKEETSLAYTKRSCYVTVACAAFTATLHAAEKVVDFLHS